MLAKIADTPFDFAVVFMALTAIYGIITSLILFWYPVKQAHNKHLLGISLFAYSWYCLIICLVYSHVIISVPHLFRTSTPLMFLVAPASYLYVRSTINGERQFKRYDWVHVIPFVLVTIDFLPFFLKSSAYKMQDINNYLTHGEVVSALHESILPENLNFIIRVILSILYVSLQWKALIRFLSQASVRVRKKYHVLTGWLLAFTLLITLITINFCVVFIVNAFHIYIPVVRLVFNLLLSIHLLVVIIVLALNPKVLYSFEDNYLFIAQPVHDVSGRNDKVIIIKSAIDHILLQDQCFLKQGYSLSAMAKDLNISVPVLSAVINSEYKLSFTDLINKYRIEYIIKNLSEQQISNYTFEGIAFESGFKSRITFYRAFVKVTGQTPSDYFRKVN